MNESDRPIILVTGATGAQGGSVTRHLLARGRFAVRVLTRNPRSETARKFRELGAETVRGGLADLASLRKAMSGCYGAFGVTRFWANRGGGYARGINLVDAVADTGVGHFVLSTIRSVERLTNRTLPVLQSDPIAGAVEYARELALPTTFVRAAYHYDDLLAWFARQRQEDGSYRFGFRQEDIRLAGIAIEDVGGAVATIFERREDFLCSSLGLAGDDRTRAEYAAIISGIAGIDAAYHHVAHEHRAANGYPGAADLSRTRELYADVQDFSTWLGTHRERFRLALDARCRASDAEPD